MENRLWPLLAAVAVLIAAMAPVAASQSVPIGMMRYNEPVEVMCAVPADALPFEITKLLGAAKHSMAAHPGAFKVSTKAASVADVGMPQKYNMDRTVIVQIGSVATLSGNPGAYCVPVLDVEIYMAGMFMPYVLMPPMSTAAFQVSLWNVSSWKHVVPPSIALSIVNALPRDLTVDNLEPPIEVDGTPLANALLPVTRSVVQATLPSTSFNTTYSTLGMVEAYFQQNVGTVFSKEPFGTILVEEQPDPVENGVHYILAYVLAQPSKDQIRFHLYQASFFIENSRRKLMESSRKLLYYGGSSTDGGKPAGCANGYCVTLPQDKWPPGCYRGSRSYPGCTVACYCY